LSSAEPVGLLAGSGRFPVLFAQKARSLGIPVVCVGVRHEAPAELAGLVDRFYWAGVARLGRMIRCFKRAGVRRAVMTACCWASSPSSPPTASASSRPWTCARSCS
jgi:DUF1009 family protein